MRSHHVMRVLVLVLLAVAGTLPLAAQQGSQIKGKLTNSLSHDAIAGATVTIEETGQKTTSGPDGAYELTNVPQGHYHLSVSASGFVRKRQEITVSAAPMTMELEIDPELHYSEVVSVSPDARNQFDSYQATNVLAGQELAKELQGTLGATLEAAPGVALRAFGPGPARPVIRGLDGDRVLILEDGQRMGDLSSQSGDHGVNVNPASASRIEVVRGPATLLYGANAIGGLVNVITNEIPIAPVKGANGSFTLDGGSAAREGGGAGEITAGNGAFAVHVSGSGRRSGDYNTPAGRIDNSYSRAGFAEVGAAYTGANGYLGGSVAYDRTHYGIPLVEEGQTNLNPRRQIVNLRGEQRKLSGFLDSFRVSFGYRRYRHDELDGDTVATSFKNDTTEFEVMANHKKAGPLKGSFGAWAMTRAFDTRGEEVLSPAVDQKGVAGFFYEEVTAPHVTFQFGGRVDHASFTPKEDFAARDFTNVSASVGLLVHPTDATTIAFSLARASRNPALEELYFHGPHPGNFAIENGDENLESEHAAGFDVSVRWRQSRASGEVTYFLNQINNFIFRELSGELEDDLPVTFFAAGDARLQGIESHLDLRVTDEVVAEGGVDYVRGELTTTGNPLPRMPPLRGRIGLRYQKNALQIGGALAATAKQDRVFGFETPTEGSNLLKAFASYSFTSGRAVSTLTARLDNASDRLYHNHLNYLKDLAPEVGRNFRLIYSIKF